MSQTREEPKPKSFHASPPDFLSKKPFKYHRCHLTAVRLSLIWFS